MTILDIITRHKDEASDGLEGVNKSLGKLGGTAGKVAVAGLGLATAAVTGVAAAAVGAGVAALNLSTDIQNATNNIAAQMGISQDEAAGFEGVMKDIFANNFGENFDDIGAAITTVSQGLGEMPDAALQGITEDAFAMRDAFGLEVSESVMAAKNLMTEFGLDGEQAMDFIAKGMQSGLNASGDFVDSISEYGNLFGDAGFSADQMYNIMATGAETGVLGVDKIADAVKEMGVKLGEGGTDTRAAFDDIGLSFEDMSGTVSDGSATWGDYFDDIVGGIEGIEDPIERQKVQVGIFGTMAEDLGVSFTEGLSTAGVALEDMSGATEALNAQYDNWPSMWEGAKRSALLALEPLGEQLMKVGNDILPIALDAFEKLTKWLSTNLPPAIQKVKDIIADLRQKWETNFGGIRDFVMGVWDVITKEFDAFVKLFQGDFEGFARGMLDAWETLWTTVIDFLGELWTMAKPHLVALWKYFVDWFNAQDWAQIGRDIVAAISDALSTFDKFAGAKITEWKATFWAWVDSVDWAALAHSIVTAVVAGLSWFASQVGTQLAKWWQAFSDWATDPATWNAIGLAVAEFILDGLDVIAKIDAALALWWQAFVTWFTTQPWDEHGETVKTGILAGLTEIWATVSGAFETMLTEIQTWFTEPERFKSLGHNIMAGLKAGIDEKIGAVVETIQGLADWLNNIWQTAQDAHSPSKVWWQFGFDLMSGLANGISDSATMPVSSIENLFKDLDVASTAGIITAMGNAVTAISKSIAPAIKALEELQKFNVPRGVLGKFEELLFQINWVVRGFAAFAWKLGDKSLNEAKKFAEVFLGLSDVIYNLGDILAHIKRVEIPTGIADKFDKLVAEAHSLVMIFATATSELEEEAAPQIIAYVDAASAIFDLVEKAIESMQFLTGVDMKAILKDGYHLRDQMIIFRNIARSTMREFSLAAAEIDAEMSDAVGALATAAESVFGLVEVVIEKAKFLSDADLSVILKDGYHLHDQTIIFRNIVRSTMRLFAEAAKEMRTDGINAVQEYIGAARDVFGIIEEALTAIGLIAEYTGFAELLPKIELFRSDLMDVATELINAIGGMSLDMQEMLRTSGSLAENVTSVLGVIAPALEALASISDYVRLDNLWVLMLEFGESLLQLMYGLNRSMGEINLYIGAEILKTSAEISDSINSVLGVIQPALEALAGLREFVRFDDLWVKLIEFGQELLYLVYGLNRSLGEVNKYIGLEVLKTAAEIATNVTTVIGVVGPALEALGNIGEFVKVENMNAKLTEFMDQLSDAIGGEQGLVARLNEIAGLVGEVEIETASNFATSVAAILGNVMDAFRTLGEMANTDMPGGLKSILTDMVSVLKSAIPDAALAGYDFGTAWINGVREALGAFTLETGLGGTGGGLAVATAGVATAGGLTTNLNVGGLTFNTTISNQMDEEEFHFRVVETIRSLV